MPEQLFVFIQLEFPWALGPADGRYLVRRPGDGEPQHVVVLGTLDADGQPPKLSLPSRTPSPLRRLRSRRSLPTDAEPALVDTSRVTVIDPVALSAEGQARAWLAELDREREVGAAVAVVNRVIHLHRLAAADAYTHEVSPDQALVIRAGWGEGEQVADGRWLHARALPWRNGAAVGGAAGSRQGRAAGERSWTLRPQERLAALLGGRGRTLICEELTLRARQDLDNGRPQLAALELESAYSLAVPELQGEELHNLTIRIAELEQLRAGVSAQAELARALAAGPPRETQDIELDGDALAHALERLEATLRARTAVGV
jgi:hypothetical protein